MSFFSFNNTFGIAVLQNVAYACIQMSSYGTLVSIISLFPHENFQLAMESLAKGMQDHPVGYREQSSNYILVTS
jgi:hypothetical protein